MALFHDLHFVDGDGNIQERYLPRLLSDAAPFFTPTGPGRYLSSDRFFAFQMLRYAGFHTITTMIARLSAGRLRPRLQHPLQRLRTTRHLWIRLSLAGKVAYLDQSLAHYRIHGNNITSNNLKVVEDIARLLESPTSPTEPIGSPMFRIKACTCGLPRRWATWVGESSRRTPFSGGRGLFQRPCACNLHWHGSPIWPRRSSLLPRREDDHAARCSFCPGPSTTWAASTRWSSICHARLCGTVGTDPSCWSPIGPRSSRCG